MHPLATHPEHVGDLGEPWHGVSSRYGRLRAIREGESLHALMGAEEEERIAPSRAEAISRRKPYQVGDARPSSDARYRRSCHRSRGTPRRTGTVRSSGSNIRGGANQKWCDHNHDSYDGPDASASADHHQHSEWPHPRDFNYEESPKFSELDHPDCTIDDQLSLYPFAQHVY